MFIPINAKADVQESKKGKLTPAQNAQLNAWCLASKTGILDCLGRCEYDTQKTSLLVTNNKVNIVFKSGYVVICGRLVECEEGTTFTLDNLANGQTGSIVLRYNLESNGEQEFVITKNTGVLYNQDLNDNPLTGKYDFELYKYSVQSNVVTLTRNGEYVPDLGGKLEQFITTLTGTGMIGIGNPPLQGYNKDKGTIEERLTALGFKEGSITLSSGTATTNKITRQGNYCILNFNIQSPISGYITSTKTYTIGSVPDDYVPKNNVEFWGRCVGDGDDGFGGRDVFEVVCTVVIDTSKNVLVKNIKTTLNLSRVSRIEILNSGYEAQPITN